MNEERLQKILARAGVASRRAAEGLIREGRVQVDGVTVHTLGTRVDPVHSEIRVDGRRIAPAGRPVYVLLHKPPGCVTTNSDPQGRPTATALLADLPERVFPVGRLDYDAEGLLLYTNDGDFAQRLQHPSFQVARTYRVKVSGRPSRSELQRLARGLVLEDGPFRAEDVREGKVNPQSTWLCLTIREGRNRIVKRALAALGYSVERLIRVSMGGVELGGLQRGQHRFLTAREVARLRGERKA